MNLAAPTSIGTETESMLDEVVWKKSTEEISSIEPATENWKIQSLPLARVKKIMKSEEFVLQELEKDRLRQEGQYNGETPNIKFMISQEAPLMMSKACELMIRELTVRAWQHTERSRRRTLQRQDFHAAVGETEVYDFLIDIVPRVATIREPSAPAAEEAMASASSAIQDMFDASNGSSMAHFNAQQQEEPANFSEQQPPSMETADNTAAAQPEQHDQPSQWTEGEPA